MLGVLSSQRSIQGVLYSQGSTLGVLFPHIPMNMSGQLRKTLQQGGNADQEHASRLKLVQVSSIHLLHRGLTFGNNQTRSGGLVRSLPTVDARGSSRLYLPIALAHHQPRPSPCSCAF